MPQDKKTRIKQMAKELRESQIVTAKQVAARGVLVVPDWPGSEVDCLMKQAGRVVQLERAMELEYESPPWMESNTFRGWPSFKMNIFRII